MSEASQNTNANAAAASVSGARSSDPPTKSPAGGHKKRNLTLDLKTAPGGPHQLSVPASSGASEQVKTSPGFLLTSPDVQMLQLASPDLEKFIIQGLMGANTPTPTQLVFPKNVTEEQESYAKGFVDALNSLHRNGTVGMAYNVLPANQGNVAFNIGQVNGQNVFPQFFTLNQSHQLLQPLQPPQQQQHQQAMPSHPGPMTIQMSGPHGGQLHLQQPKMEPYSPSVSPAPSDPQTVPSDARSTQSSGSSVGASPGTAINMDHQHKMKVERKRERNRLAAAKCRQRKLARISELEERVRELKEHNSGLEVTASGLRGDLAVMRQELLLHMQSGCSIDMSQGLMAALQRQQHS